MTDGALSTIVSLAVGVLAAALAVVVAPRTRERDRPGTPEAEGTALRDARLRAELHLVEVRARQLRTQIARVQGGRTDLVSAIETADKRRDPASAMAKGALMLAHPQPHRELSRRLRQAGDAHVIPFPFLAERGA
jgi:hypothetical protein